MNSIAASVDTALPADGYGHRNALRARVLSALVLAPVALGALFAGGIWFVLFIAAAVGGMAWEWRRLCAGGRFDLAGWVFTLAACLSVGLAFRFGVAPALISAALGMLAVGLLARARGDRSAGWSAVGVIVVAGTGVALVWLRAQPEIGTAVVFWLVVSIWFTDCFAYFTGRAVGGPRLAPRISPNKTWAGLVGGMAGAAAWSAGYVVWLGRSDPLAAAAAGALVAVLGQIGDIGVSCVKRRFGAKDSSNLIPGHGGLLDRADGLILTAPALALALAFWPAGAGQ